MATKKEKVQHEPLTEKQKEDLRVLVPLEKAKQFISSLQVVIRAHEEFNDYEINAKATTIKDTSLKIEFKLKDIAIDRIIREADPFQKKINDFEDPENE